MALSNLVSTPSPAFIYLAINLRAVNKDLKQRIDDLETKIILLKGFREQLRSVLMTNDINTQLEKFDAQLQDAFGEVLTWAKNLRFRPTRSAAPYGYQG